MRPSAARVLTTLVAWATALTVALPLLWALVLSFKSELDAVTLPPRVLRSAWTLDTYRAVLGSGTYYRCALNSLVTAGSSTLIALMLALPSAWAMAFVPSRHTRNLLLWMLSTKMLPPVGVLIPVYLIYQKTSLLDTRTGLVILLTVGNLPVVVWMLFASLRELPTEVLEAARMDGAGVMQELLLIAAPLALPAIASTFFLTFTLAWNEAFWSLNLTSAAAAPLTAFIATFSSPQGLFWAKLSAASMLAVAPVLLMGWLCQRRLVSGLTFGAVKA